MQNAAAIPHSCEATAKVSVLEQRVTELAKELEAIKALHVRRSERMRPVKKEARAAGEIPPLPDGRKDRKKDSRGALPKEVVRTHVPAAECMCPRCHVAMEKVRETQATIVERGPEKADSPHGRQRGARLRPRGQQRASGARVGKE